MTHLYSALDTSKLAAEKLLHGAEAELAALQDKFGTLLTQVLHQKDHAQDNIKAAAEEALRSARYVQQSLSQELLS